MRPAIDSNASHLAYAYCFSVADPDVIMAYQEYSDEAASQAFLRQPAYVAYLQEVEPLLTDQPTVAAGTPIWIKQRP